MGIYKTGIWKHNNLQENMLPEGYTELDYIETTGTQYIDTGIFLQPNMIIEMNINFTNLNDNRWFGDSNNILATNTERVPTRVNGNWNDNYVSAIEVNTSYILRWELLTGSTKLFCDNTLQQDRADTVTAQNTYSAYLGSVCDSAVRRGSPSFKLYDFSCVLNGHLIRHFIPCIKNSNNEIGLYDLVTQQFYTNAGTGSFSGDGPGLYQAVEYIESTNAQRIDTEAQIFNKTNHDIIIDFEPTLFYNYSQLFGSTYDADTYEAWIYASGQLAARYRNVRYSNDNQLVVNTRYLVDFKKVGTELSKYVDGALIGTGTANTASVTDSLILFCSGTDYSRFKMYSCQLYAEDELVRDYVPCIRKTDSKPGLYDRVNRKFYINTESGADFTAGAVTNHSDISVKIYKPDDVLEANGFIEI